MRNPDNRLAVMLVDYKFESRNHLKEGTVIEVDPYDKDGWLCGYWREKGTVFAVETKDIRIIEDAITPQLFDVRATHA
jgi:hypothetical protein